MPERPHVTIIRHRGESPKKCSLTLLRGLDGFRFHRYPKLDVDLSDHLRLAIGAPLLTAADRRRPLLLLDASWRRSLAMNRTYEHVEARALPALVTAYPRVSKSFPDPEDGLASIEALIAAFAILGWTDDALRAAYPRSEAFIAANPDFFH